MASSFIVRRFEGTAFNKAAFLALVLAAGLVCFPFPSSAGPPRVVSLYPGHTDNIIALGAGDCLVAVSRSDGADGLLRDLPHLPPKLGPERVIALNPDIVLMRSMTDRTNPNLADVLRRAGVAVYLLDAPSWEEFPDYLVRLSEILEIDPEEAVRKWEGLRRHIADQVASRLGARRPRVFLEATSKELHTCAPDSWASRLIALAGGENVASSAAPLRRGSSLASWGTERLLEVAGTVDIYLLQQGTMNAATESDVRGRSWFSVFSNARLAAVPEGLISRPSLLGLEKGGMLLVEIFSESPSVGF